MHTRPLNKLVAPRRGVRVSLLGGEKKRERERECVVAIKARLDLLPSPPPPVNPARITRVEIPVRRAWALQPRLFNSLLLFQKKKKKKREREKRRRCSSLRHKRRERETERVKPLNIRYVSFIPVNFVVKKFLTYLRNSRSDSILETSFQSLLHLLQFHLFLINILKMYFISKPRPSFPTPFIFFPHGRVVFNQEIYPLS